MSNYVVIADVWAKPPIYRIAYHARSEAQFFNVKMKDNIEKDLFIQLANPFTVWLRGGKVEDIKNEFRSYKEAKQFIEDNYEHEE